MTKMGCLSFLLLLAVSACFASEDNGYRILKKIPLPGDGQWDYVAVDDVNRRVYVSHGSNLEVLDADSGAVVGKIPAPETDASTKSTSQAMHGAAIAQDLGRGFTSNGQTSTMTIFDLKTLKKIADVPVGEGPDGVLYDPASRRAFTFSNHTKGATAVNGADGTVAGNIDLGGKPEAAVADGSGNVFVNIQDRDIVVKFDPRKLLVSDRWKVDPCHEPTSMAIDAANHRLFVGCRSKLLAVLNTDDGHLVTTLPIGGGTDAAAYDADAHLVFTANGEGTVTVIQQESPDKYSVVENVKTEAGARTMALDPKTHRIFLSVADRTIPPPAVPGQPPPSRTANIVPNSFRVLIVGK